MFLPDECPEDSCSSIPCQHNGICVPARGQGQGQIGPATAGNEVDEEEWEDEEVDFNSEEKNTQPGVCQCPLGYGGDFCEKALDIKVRECKANQSFEKFSEAGTKEPHYALKKKPYY